MVKVLMILGLVLIAGFAIFLWRSKFSQTARIGTRNAALNRSRQERLAEYEFAAQYAELPGNQARTL